jgi:hypothetical protein
MWQNLKKAWNTSKAFITGAVSYVKTLFSTPGTFEEAHHAAAAEYTRSYENSMALSSPSISGASRQAIRGNFSDALDQVGHVIGITNPDRNINQEAERERQAIQWAQQDREREERQDARRNDRKKNVTDPIRAKYNIPEGYVARIKQERALASSQNQQRNK